MFEKAITGSVNVTETISYAYRITLQLIQNRKFRNAILKLLVRIYSNLANPDYVNVIQCLIFLDEAEQAASILENLVRAGNYLMAYQLCFDLYESATQQFIFRVKSILKALISVPQAMETDIKVEEDQKSPNEAIKVYIDKLLLILSGEITINMNMQFLIKNNHSDLLVLKKIKVLTEKNPKIHFLKFFP